jgi:YD repeat-containing protein
MFYQYNGDPLDPKTQNYVTQITDPIGNSISFTYDDVGNQTSVTDGLGSTTSFAYDPNGNTITYTYDPNSNINAMDITVGTTTVTRGYGFNPLDQFVTLSRNGSNLANIMRIIV